MKRNGQGFSDKLERVLVSDCKARFVDLVRDHPEEIKKTLVEKCAKSGAKKCLLALISGELSDPPPVLDQPESESGVTALAYVAFRCPDPQIIELMLNRCNAVPLVNVNCTIASVDGLPIHFVLIRFSYLEHLYPWYRGDSLIKLVILLCQWKTKPLLDSTRLLAQHTLSINNIAYTFVNFGALKQFGALLLVAREKVMAPFETGLTIRQYLTIHIDSLPNHYIDNEEYEYRNMLLDARTLLDVFDKAGDALNLYVSSMQKYVSVSHAVNHVCKLLKEAKVYVHLFDSYLDSFFQKHNGLSGVAYSKFMESDPYDSSLLRATPAGRTTPAYLSGQYPCLKSLSVPKNLVPSASQPRLMSTTACQVGKISKPLDHANINPLLKHLAFMTHRLKNRLRFL